MFNENLPPPDPQPSIITDDHRARISQNFRAAQAQALASRKRPFEFASLIPLSKCINTNRSCARAPLSEISNGVPLEEDAFATPAKALLHNSLDDFVSPGSVLDDEIDDAFLSEVDAILERSAAKERPSAERMEEKDDSMPGKYCEYLQKLNDEQREAACSGISVPLMIVAGPGSGKTSTMVGRILMLLKEGIGLTNILAMTFTTAAASEMRDRIASVVGKGVAKELMISTFHSFCLQLCRSHAEKLGRTPEFLIYGHGQQRKAVIEALRLAEDERKKGQELDLKIDDISCNYLAHSFKEKSKKWQKFVTQSKASGKTPEECKKMGDEMGAQILGHYSGILTSCNALDYHDFISSSVKLLTDFPEVYKECLYKWKAIVVDEFQDTSSMQ